MYLKFLVRDVIYTSRAYATMSVSVCLSVTEVLWRIIANLGFKLRSQFTAHCGRGGCGREGRDHLALCYPLLYLLIFLLIPAVSFVDLKNTALFH